MNVPKVMTVVGARPQFVKAAALRRALDATAAAGCPAFEEVLLHTGQHYDADLSQRFFQELPLTPPRYELGVGSGPHGAQTAAMLAGIERALLAERPAAVLVFGDTNSTLAAALAAAKLHIRIAHVEAGLRSFDDRMPEEINRVLTDRLSTWRYCPSDSARLHLRREGIEAGVEVVGDLMYDIFLAELPTARAAPLPAELGGLTPGEFALATIHRAENTDDPARLSALVAALERLARELPVVMPLHPRTRHALEAGGLRPVGLHLIPPVGYHAMLRLELEAKVVLTDSGGVQKEAYWAGVPCVTLRPTTEWPETVAAGWNRLATPEELPGATRFQPPAERPALYGHGDAATRIVQHLAAALRG